MWGPTASFVLKNRLVLLLLLLATTCFMGWHASKVQLSYDFARAVPTDNPKYVSYQNFRREFGEDGNLMAIGLQSDHLFADTLFNDYRQLSNAIKQVKGVEDVLSVASALNLVKDSATARLQPKPIFTAADTSQAAIDSGAHLFESLPFYKGLLYNPAMHTYLYAIRINKDILNSKARVAVVDSILSLAGSFGRKHGLELHYSGLPLIRTSLATRIAAEMKWFVIGSMVLLAFILLLFFRSVSTVLLSITVVIIGVIWSLGTMHLLDYKITLLNALIPTLVVVIGIPNCVYFLNKYHLSYVDTCDKHQALVQMVSKMGIVTLFCNIAAAIGFAVFALTKSAILKEFGIVAGINIMGLFVISFILIPAVLSYLPAPKPRHTKYLNNKLLLAILLKLETWSFGHRKMIYGVTVVVVAVAIAGIARLRSEGFILDDLPKTDRLYIDLKFFEKNFKGVMPLEIVIDTKSKNGIRKYGLSVYTAMDSLSQFIAAQPEMARPLSIVEGLKFAKQAYYDGDSNNYTMPSSYDLPFLASYLNAKPDPHARNNNFSKLLSSFIDSSKQRARISINMADVGSRRLPELLARVQARSDQLFDSSKYHVEFTGTSVTFLEGSSFIIHGLQDSIMYAFILISLCMIYLFRSFRILVCSLIPNLIPLVITAGIMGWAGVALKPSTVLIFSVALGIAIDITIRFLVNYKQEQKDDGATQEQLVAGTIQTTGISIIYTSLVLIAGFVIFCFSGFGGTQALGWLTSITLVVATFTNLILLPALLISTSGKKNKKQL